MRRAWVLSLFVLGGCVSETELHVAAPEQPEEQVGPPQALRARVRDLLSKDAIAGAQIFGVESDFTAVTDADGAFTISAPFPARIAIARDGYHAEEMRVPAVVDLEDEATFFLFPAREPTEA